MCLSNIEKKALKYKEFVEKDKIETLFKELQRESIKELTRIEANQKEDSKNNTYSRRLIDFIAAEIEDRNIRHLRWTQWTITAATMVIAFSSCLTLYATFCGRPVIEKNSTEVPS